MHDVSAVEARDAGAAACPALLVFDLIAHKWTLAIIHTLHGAAGPVRFRQLQRTVGAITAKELTKRLRELERGGLVVRAIFAEVPPRVEYTLTPLGGTLIPTLVGLHNWASEHGPAIAANRRKFDQATPTGAAVADDIVR